MRGFFLFFDFDCIGIHGSKKKLIGSSRFIENLISHKNSVVSSIRPKVRRLISAPYVANHRL